MATRFKFTLSWKPIPMLVLQRMIRFHEYACNTSAETVRAIEQLEAEIRNDNKPDVQLSAKLAKQGLLALGHAKLLDRAEAKHSVYRTSIGVWCETEKLDGRDVLAIRSEDIGHSHGVDGLLPMIQMAMRLTDVEEPVRLEWQTKTGGAAALVTRSEIRRMTTHDWLEAEATGVSLRVQMGQDLEPGDKIWGDIGHLCELVGTFESRDPDVELREFMDLEDLARRGGRDVDQLKNLSPDRVWPVVKAIAEHALEQPNEGSTEHPMAQVRRTEMFQRVAAYAGSRIKPSSPSPSH